jgi:hypothetical protein
VGGGPLLNEQPARFSANKGIHKMQVETYRCLDAGRARDGFGEGSSRGRAAGHGPQAVY